MFSYAFTSAASLSSKRHFCRAVAALNCLLFATLVAGNANAAAVDVCTPAELAAAADKAGPGDTIVMCDKTWPNTEIQFDVRGTERGPITLTVETPGNVVLTGSSQIRLSGTYAVIDGLRFEGRYTGSAANVIEFADGGRQCFDCRVTNINMVDYNPSSESKVTRWVVMHGQRNRVDHSHFRGKNNLGSVIQVRRDADNQVPNYHLIDHNLFEDRPDFTGAGNQNGDTLEIGSMGKYSALESHATVEFNYLRNIDSDYEIITIKSSGNTIRYNVVEASRGVVSLRNGHGNTVHGNFILGRGKARSGGIRISGSDHIVSSNYISDINPTGIDSYAALRLMSGRGELIESSGSGTMPFYKFERASNARVFQNTIVDAGVNVVFGSDEPLPPKDVSVLGNLVLRGQGPAIVDTAMGPNINFEDNMCFGTDGGLSLLGIKLADPLFSPDANGIERPAAKSPVLDVISNLQDVTIKSGALNGALDMDGEERSGFADIGADEVVANERGRGPISICGVGPTTYRTDLPASCGKVTADVAPPKPPSSLLIDQ